MARPISKNVSTILSIIVVVAAWAIVSSRKMVNPIIFPDPLEVLAASKIILTDRREFLSILASSSRVAKGVLISSLIGFPLGVLLSYYRVLFGYVDWLIELVRSIPPAVVLPVFFFASSQSGADNDGTRVRLVIFGCLPILLMQITDTARRIPSQRLEFAKLIGARPAFLLRRILMYELLPNFFIALRTIVSFAIVIVIVTEMIYPPTLGIGSRIIEWQLDSHVDYVYAYALIAGLLGIAANRCCLVLERKVVYWKS